MVQLILGGQIAEAHDCIESEKMKKHAKDTDELVSQTSHKMGRAMMEYIYGVSAETGLPRDRRRKWSDWEI